MTGIVTILGSVAVWIGLVWGWGLPVGRRLNLSPGLRFVVTPFAGLLGLHVAATALYLTHAGPGSWMLIALPAIAGWWDGRQVLSGWWKLAEVRRMVTAWLIVTGVALLLLGGIRNVSGGDWIGDWVGHFHRASYFLHPDGDWAWMFERDPLVGRPPLQNLVTAALMAVGGESFAHYQVFTLLLGSLAVLPCILLLESTPRAWRWGIALLVCNPLVMQNLTYTWTKMGTNAWVLLAIAAGWHSLRERSHRFTAGLTASIAMGAAVIAHYSAAVHLVVLGSTWLWINARAGVARLTIKQVAAMVGAGALVLASWWSWAVQTGGAEALVSSTTTSQYVQETAGPGAAVAALGENIARTLVPHPVLPAPHRDPAATDPLAAWRDFWFQLYQTNLVFALGGATVLMLGWRRGGPLRTRWALPIVATVLLGIAVHPAVSHWGLAHICLQPLVLVGLIWAAVQLTEAPAALRRLTLLLLGTDALLGIGLQAVVQFVAVPPNALIWQDGAPLRALLGQATWANAAAKQAFQYQFIGDMLTGPILLGIVVAIIGAAWRLWPRSAAAGDQQ